jgi:catechol 2,3-dioxygenase-like lactoylglutathione lyase family enzyme
MIDHVGFEVSDLERSAVFYDAVFGALGGRRVHAGPRAIAYGTVGPELWIVARGRRPAPGYGHIALTARGRAAVVAAHRTALVHGGRDDGAPGLRPTYGPLYYAAYVLDPDGLRIEFVSGSR